MAVLSGCHRDLASYVNPLVGTDLHGHTTPAAIVPFGMVQPGPDTRLSGWDGCSGYHYSDDTIYGFSQTHLSGTGCDDYCDVLMMPVSLPSAPYSLSRNDYLSTFKHTKEKVEAGYYKIRMDNGLTVELTASQRVAYHNYHYNTEGGGIVVDLTHRDRLLGGGFAYDSALTLLTGWRESSCWNPDQKLFFAMSFDVVPDGITYYGRDGSLALDTTERVKAYISLPSGCNAVGVKVAVSSVDIAGAVANLMGDKGVDFASAKEAARASWNTALGKITLRNALLDDSRRFYTALYHCMTAPYLYSDIDGRYRGVDDSVHHVECRADGSPHEIYTVFSLWDTYRALHPLLTILEPGRTEDFVYTMLQHYLQGGELTMWELWGHETHCMIGYHAAPVILDAMRSGLLTGWDTLYVPFHESFSGCGSVSKLPLPLLNENVNDGRTRLAALLAAMLQTSNRTDGQRHYAQDGYLSSEYDNESVSKTLEYAYDDWCIARFAELVGGVDASLAPQAAAVYKEYIRRSQSWKNLLDDSGFMHPRRNGGFVTPFDPTEVNNHYTEANCWQYSTYVPHDVYGWIEALGGTGAAHQKLDSLFFGNTSITGRNQSDITGLIGQYAHGNEPSHHAAYLFAYLGNHKKGDGLVHLIRNRLYAAEPYGLCGNDDCGQMSAWYVLSSLGFYPVCPGSGEWVLTSPLFHHSYIHLDDGRTVAIHRKEWHSGCFATKATLSDSSGVRLPLCDRITPTPHFGTDNQRFSDSCTVSLSMPKWVQGCNIYYTTDGSLPDSASLPYEGPFVVYRNIAVKAVAYHPETGYSKVVSASYVRFEKDKTVSYNTHPDPMYSEGESDALVDGIEGNANFRLGGWQGWKTDLDIVVDLLEVKSVKEVSLCCLQDMKSWIFYPTSVTVESSVDGDVYTPYGTLDATTCSELGVRKEATQDEQQKAGILLRGNGKARYLHIVARNYGAMPSWHISSGEQAWLFCSEISVR
ncbi:MAG: GH92 family glycosyl hydrolase [Bacteroidales bacterium]|nr:GH92 family glycosyl hydrolase [Bacteroidales bacterium]